IAIGRRIALSRHALDEALVAAAAAAGVTVLDETRAWLAPPAAWPTRQVVLHRAAAQTAMDARLVIVATGLAGASSQGQARVAAASYVGLGAICREPPLPIPPGTLLMACTARGYVGVTEIEGGAFDLAAAVDPRALAAAPSAGQLVESILAEARLEPSTDLAALPWRGTLPLTRRAASLASHRCLLVGDAARYVEPFTGEGIGWAIHSALLAAKLTAAFADPGDPAVIARWPSLYRAALGRQQRNCQAACCALRHAPVRALVTRGLRWAPLLGGAATARLDRPLAAPTF
ncbi:MAG TPA: hypothetical protein VEQ85_15000, partial [Lacipirellulaceae bacterium]|nr:hypothetical protein [Lacipirellulaceae bacterium]